MVTHGNVRNALTHRRAYDVGDPVFFVDDTGIEDWYIVTRINLLTTVRKRFFFCVCVCVYALTPLVLESA